ncbi:MAG: response regulator [Chloroflexota bacterium]|nr:MAG: hypothetical protein DIU80_18020 [Chloroflexota bacterium]
MTPRPLIVLAEDTLAIREMTAQALTDAGYDVVCSSAGAQAFELLRHLQPDLVVLDLHLFGQDTGLGVLRQMRARRDTAHIPAIVYSADAIRLEEVAGDIAGYGGVALAKPFEIDALLAAVHEQLRAGGEERARTYGERRP